LEKNVKEILGNLDFFEKSEKNNQLEIFPIFRKNFVLMIKNTKFA
jgi:hypothetical protein